MRVIAETLNSSHPTVHAALAAGDRRWIEASVRRQVEAGVDQLDLNAGSFPGSEAMVLGWLAEVVEAAGDRPLSLDSGDPAVLLDTARRRRHPPLLNSLELGGEWPGELLSLVREGKAELVVQLRRGSSLPEGDHAGRAAEAVERLRAARLPLERCFLDPVLLPWGDGFDQAEGLLAAVAEGRGRWPRLGWIGGLSNLSWGHERRHRLHREWLPRLVGAGFGALILNPFEPGLVELARR